VEEEKNRRWRIACSSIAAKAVATLQNYWPEREGNATAQAVYDGLLTSLGSVGIEEISPRLSELVEENDRRYRIVRREGLPPYSVSRVLYPGYYFRPKPGILSEGEDRILLEPAVIEVQGGRSNS